MMLPTNRKKVNDLTGYVYFNDIQAKDILHFVDDG